MASRSIRLPAFIVLFQYLAILSGLARGTGPAGDLVDSVCAGQQPLFAGVDRDLEPWRRAGGITAASNTAGLKRLFASEASRYYVGVVIRRGDVHVTFSNPAHRLAGGAIAASFLLDLYDVSLRWRLPDVEFAIQLGDRPKIELPQQQKAAAAAHGTASGSSSQQPQQQSPVVLGYSKAEGFADVMVPHFHFRCFVDSFDDLLPRLGGEAAGSDGWVPWSSRKDVALGRHRYG